MPVLNAIEMGSSAPPGDAPGLLAGAVHAACAAHYDPAHHTFDYRRFGDSREFAALRAAARALAAFDCAALGIGLRLAFWLNVYNALVLHAVVARRAAAGVRALGDFFSDSRYVVGGHVFSLDEIEHGLLRVNAPRFAFGAPPLAHDDERCALAPYVFDERVHFAMYSACCSSPPPAAYLAEGLPWTLERAARDYLAAHARVDAGSETLTVPKLFDWYARDFGGPRGVLEFVAARLERPEDLDALDRCGERLRLRYTEFDWTLNAS